MTHPEMQEYIEWSAVKLEDGGWRPCGCEGTYDHALNEREAWIREGADRDSVRLAYRIVGGWNVGDPRCLPSA